jgi:hypothetical protein
VQNFSNQDGTHATSEGCSLTGSTYSSGKHGLSLNMHGLESTNNNNCTRRIVMHSNWYMENGGFGRSWGCLVFSQSDRNEIFNAIKEGSITCNFGGKGSRNSGLQSDSPSPQKYKKSKKGNRRRR